MDKILVIQTAFLGDVVLATGVIEKLKEHYPEAKIDFLLRKGNEGVVKNHPLINKLYIFNKGDKLRSLWTILREIRSQKYDLVINLHRFLSSGIIAVLSNARRIAGFDKNPISFFYNERSPHVISAYVGKHEIERNHELIAKYTDNEPSAPKLYPSKDDYAKVINYKTRPYVVIAPASVWFTKQWPVGKWIEFLDAIDEVKVYLIGAPSDIDICESITEKSKNTHLENLAGKLTPLESVALMQDASMNYVNDSAPLHFASSVNAPITAIFNSTIPEFGFGPLSQDSAIIEVKEPLTCRPCGLHGRKTCPEVHFKCAHDIKVEQLKSRISG